MLNLLTTTFNSFEQQPNDIIAEFHAYNTLFFAFFLIGLFGMVFNYQNFLVTMMSVELAYLGVISSFVITAAKFMCLSGYVYGLLLIIVAASESAIGLGLLIVVYRFGSSINLLDFHILKT